MTITLEQILRNMTYGEFSQLHLGNFLPGDHESEVDPKAYAQLISHVNTGLKAIYSRFLLSKQELTIVQDESILTYTLAYPFAVTEPTVPGETVRYILDTAGDPQPISFGVRELHQAGQWPGR